MSEENSELDQIIQHAVDENPAGLADVVKTVLNDKTWDVINNNRKEVAASYFTKQDIGDDG